MRTSHIASYLPSFVVVPNVDGDGLTVQGEQFAGSRFGLFVIVERFGRERSRAVNRVQQIARAPNASCFVDDA